MRRFRFIHRGPEAAADGGGTKPEELVVELDGSRCRFLDGNGGPAEGAAVSRLADGRLSLLFDDGRQLCGRVATVSATGAGGEVEVVTGSARRKIALADPLRDRMAHGEGSGAGEQSDEEIRALMPGRVVEVTAAVGQSVAAGALILVLEAMKMQNEIRCKSGGTVVRIGAERGTAVDGGALLAVIHSGKS